MPLITLPKIKDIEKPLPFEYEKKYLENGITMYKIPSTHALGLTKFEIVLDRGRFHEEKRLSSRFCCSMLKEGTRFHTSDEINDHFDFYGADFHVRYHLDYTTLTIVCLRKYMPKVLPLFFEILQFPKFDADDLTPLKKRVKSKLKLAEADNDALSFRILTEKIFGSNHAYGYNSNEVDIEAITVDDLFHFHEENYLAAHLRMYLSGSVDDELEALIYDQLEKIPRKETNGLLSVYTDKIDIAHQPGEFYVKNNYTLDAQSSVKLGQRMIQRNHPDYIGMHFLSTLFGGFFGSRLMQNIRENRGLTYNIYSDLEPMKYDGYFIIGTDIKTENIKQVLSLIWKEIDILHNELVSEKEMRTVSNYIKGYLVSSMDGVFSKSEIVKLLSLEDLPMEWIFTFFDQIDEIPSERIAQLAKNYLKKEELFTVVVN